jgi:hypothetical protein
LIVASDIKQLKKGSKIFLSAKLLEKQTLSARLLDTRKNIADADTVFARLQNMTGCSRCFILDRKPTTQARIRPAVVPRKLQISLDQVKCAPYKKIEHCGQHA